MKQTAAYNSLFQNTDGVNFYNILTKSAPMAAMESSLEFTQSHLGKWTWKLLDPVCLSLYKRKSIFFFFSFIDIIYIP